ncbi:MAG: MlaD family protein [Actinomycetota bacterium]|nr:MlaD family protein [Actinomycetota bacterium]
MITRRVVVNLVVFTLATILLVGYGTVTLLGNPFRKSMEISAVFPTTSGLYPHFSVALNGVDVGSVRSITLTKAGARVVMSMKPGAIIPSDVVAEVNLANDLGEQQVDLIPRHRGPAKPLANGATIPVARDSTPVEIGAVVRTATRLLNAIPKGNLNTVLQQAASALNGRVRDMRSIIVSSRLFSEEMLRYQGSFRALLANAPPVLNAATSVGPELRKDLANTAVLASVLAKQRYELVNLFSGGAHASTDLSTLLSTEGPNLACLIHDAAGIASNLASGRNLANLNVSLVINQEFFGAVAGITPVGPAKSLYPGDPGNPHQEWLRVRLFLPAKQPSALAYATPTVLPGVKPGAGCSTALGNGVGPATQAGFHPAGPGGHVIPAPASESVVQAGASPNARAQGTFVQSAPASYRAPLPWSPLVLVLLAGFGLALVLVKARTKFRSD